MINPGPTISNKYFLPWWPVAVFILMAIGIRLYITSSPYHYILAGADGPYMLLQIRSLSEHFRLAFPDMPILFALGAFLAKILQWLHIASGDQSIMMAVRMIDALVPPLAAIPVFLLGREIWKSGPGEDKKTSFVNSIPFYLMVAYAVVNFTPLVIFSYQLQKNSLATVLVFFFLYYAVRIVKYDEKRDYIKALVVLLLCAFTHFGSFGILLFMSIMLKISWFINSDKDFKKEVLKKASTAALTLLAIITLIFFVDPARFHRLISIPMKLFEGPVLLFFLAGQNFLLKGFTLVAVIVSNLLSVMALILIFQSKARLERSSIIIGYAMALCAILMSSPLLGLEWANRLYMLAYIPVVVLCLIVFSMFRTRWLNISLTLVFMMLIGLSLLNAIFSKSVMSISDNAYKSFRNLGILFIPGDAIVGRQDLRLLGSWEHHTKGVPQYLLTRDEFGKYHAVYFIKQVSGKSPGLREREPEVPANASSIYHDEYFEVYRLNSSEGLMTEKEKPFRGVRGTIIEVDQRMIKVKDEKSGIIKTIYLPRTHMPLAPNMKVEINGSWRPFSLAIDAETIKIIG